MLPMRGLDICQVVQVPEPSTVVHFPRASLANLRFRDIFAHRFSSFTNEVVFVILDLWMVFLGKGLETKNPSSQMAAWSQGWFPHEEFFYQFFFNPKDITLEESLSQKQSMTGRGLNNCTNFCWDSYIYRLLSRIWCDLHNSKSWIAGSSHEALRFWKETDNFSWFRLLW